MKRLFCLVTLLVAFTVWGDNYISNGGYKVYALSGWHGGNSGVVADNYCVAEASNSNIEGSLHVANFQGVFSPYAVNCIITTVEVRGFSDCKSLRELWLADTIGNIRPAAFCGDSSLERVVLPSGLTSFGRPYKAQNMSLEWDYERYEPVFYGCDSLKEIVFQSPPPLHLIESGALQYSDSIYYPVANSNVWEKVLRNSGYGGERVCYEGKWPSITKVSVNGRPVGYVEPPVTITNYVHTTVTNVVKYVPAPGSSPDPTYKVTAGSTENIVINGAAGWDAFNVPEGMTWNREAGTLTGQPTVPGAYDLLLVSGSGTDTKIMRTTVRVAEYPTIVGYVGVTFSRSGAPLDQVSKTPSYPAGLKWANNVLSGVPTKAGTYKYMTKDNVPFTIEIYAVPESNVGTYSDFVFRRSQPGDGTWEIGNMEEAVGMATATFNAKGRFTLKVQTASKTLSFSANKLDSVEDGVYHVTCSLRTGETLEAEIVGVDNDCCTPFHSGEPVVEGVIRGASGSDELVFRATIDSFYGKAETAYTTWESVGEGEWKMSGCSSTVPTGPNLKIQIAAKGTVRIAGTMPDGVKLNMSGLAKGCSWGVYRLLGCAYQNKKTAICLCMERMDAHQGCPAGSIFENEVKYDRSQTQIGE